MLLLAIAGALVIPVVALVLPSSGHDLPLAVPVCVILAYVLLRKRRYRTGGEASQKVNSSPKQDLPACCGHRRPPQQPLG